MGSETKIIQPKDYPTNNKTEMARSGVKLETAAITSESLVNSLLNSTLNIKTIALKTILIRMLVAFTTSTENFATLA